MESLVKKTVKTNCDSAPEQNILLLAYLSVVPSRLSTVRESTATTTGDEGAETGEFGISSG